MKSKLEQCSILLEIKDSKVGTRKGIVFDVKNVGIADLTPRPNYEELKQCTYHGKKLWILLNKNGTETEMQYENKKFLLLQSYIVKVLMLLILKRG